MSDSIPYGYCRCGCGQKAPISPVSNQAKGYVKGEPRRFVYNHHQRGKNSYRWSGGSYTAPDGYRRVRAPNHEKADANGYVAEHTLIAERVVGGPLPSGVEVHHVNGVRDDNTRGNLVICENHAYHALIEQRQRALDDSGHADWLKCTYCGEYDAPDQLHVFYRKGRGVGRRGHHKECLSRHNRRTYRRRVEAQR